MTEDQRQWQTRSIHAKYWVEDEECPVCRKQFVAIDQYGKYCFFSDCGWYEKKSDHNISNID